MSEAQSQPITAALQEYMTLKSQHESLFVVFYRGHWCPFCISYLKSLEALTPSIKGANGIPLIITAESAENQEKTRAASGYTGHAISDPDNDIASEMRKGGAVDVYFSEKKGYPNGMAQPAVVLIKTDGTVMYSWAITPSTMNLGGATGRPILSEVFENVMSKERGEHPQQQHKPRSTSVMSLLKEKIFG